MAGQFVLALTLLAPYGLLAFTTPEFPCLSNGASRLQDSFGSLPRHRQRSPFLFVSWTQEETRNIAGIDELIREKKQALEETRRSLFAQQLSQKTPRNVLEVVEPTTETLLTLDQSIPDKKVDAVVQDASKMQSATDMLVNKIAGVGWNLERLVATQEIVDAEQDATVDLFLTNEAVGTEVSSYVDQVVVPSDLREFLLEEMSASGVGAAFLGLLLGAILQLQYPAFAYFSNIAPLPLAMSFGFMGAVAAGMEGSIGDMARQLGEPTRLLGDAIQLKLQEAVDDMKCAAKKKVDDSINAVLDFPAFVGRSIVNKAEEVKSEILNIPGKMVGAAQAKATETVDEIKAFPSKVICEVKSVPSKVFSEIRKTPSNISAFMRSIPAKLADQAALKVDELQQTAASVPSKLADVSASKVEESKIQITATVDGVKETFKSKAENFRMRLAKMPGNIASGATTKIGKWTNAFVTHQRTIPETARAKVEQTKTDFMAASTEAVGIAKYLAVVILAAPYCAIEPALTGMSKAFRNVRTVRTRATHELKVNTPSNENEEETSSVAPAHSSSDLTLDLSSQEDEISNPKLPKRSPSLAFGVPPVENLQV